MKVRLIFEDGLCLSHNMQVRQSLLGGFFTVNKETAIEISHCIGYRTFLICFQFRAAIHNKR